MTSSWVSFVEIRKNVIRKTTPDALYLKQLLRNFQRPVDWRLQTEINLNESRLYFFLKNLSLNLLKSLFRVSLKQK